MSFWAIYVKLFAFTILGIVTCRSNTLSLLARDPLQSRHARSSEGSNLESVHETKVESMTVESSVSTRFAEVIVRSVVVNQMYTDNEATFTVQIPQSAFIYNFSMMIGDKLYIGRLMEREKAQQEYDHAREQGQSAGHVRQETPLVPNRDMDIFTTSINVASKSQVTFELIYQELLERRTGYYEQRFNVQPNQVVTNLTLIARYFEPQGFTDYYYTKPGSDIMFTASSENVVISESPEKLLITYNPTIEEQSSVDPQKGLVGQFVVRYDITHKLDAGLVMYNNDFVAQFFSPPAVKILGKSIVFVIDISGSMAGRKTEQVTQAMLSILPQLQEKDYFNIVIFDDQINTWREASVMASVNNIKSALRFSRDMITARGSTNIIGALLEALKLFRTQEMVTDDLRHYAKIIVFLTDGQPTSGETTNPKEIRTKVTRVNTNAGGGRLVAIYALGFGFNMDFNFLKHLSWENGGFARRIYDDVDAGKQLEGFYKEIKSPCYVDLQFNYMVDNMALVTNDYDVSKTSHMVYYCGSEIVVVGKFENEVIDVAEIRATGADQEVTLTSTPVTSDSLHMDPLFTERLWAYAMIKDLNKKSDILEDNTQASELKLRALNMSLKYHLVTPLTSLVVTEALGDGSSLSEMGDATRQIDIPQNGYFQKTALTRGSSASNFSVNFGLVFFFLTISTTLVHVSSI